MASEQVYELRYRTLFSLCHAAPCHTLMPSAWHAKTCHDVCWQRTIRCSVEQINRIHRPRSSRRLPYALRSPSWLVAQDGGKQGRSRRTPGAWHTATVASAQRIALAAWGGGGAALVPLDVGRPLSWPATQSVSVKVTSCLSSLVGQRRLYCVST